MRQVGKELAFFALFDEHFGIRNRHGTGKLPARGSIDEMKQPPQPVLLELGLELEISML